MKHSYSIFPGALAAQQGGVKVAEQDWCVTGLLRFNQFALDVLEENKALPVTLNSVLIKFWAVNMLIMLDSFNKI